MGNERKTIVQPVVERVCKPVLRKVGRNECHELIGERGLVFCGAPLGCSE
jgi:hypothetical protein